MASRTVTCTMCRRTFEQNQNVVCVDWEQPTCYSCALEKITQGGPPEESDLIAAHRRSGEIDDEDWDYIRAYDIARERGEGFSDPPYDEPDDGLWCSRCGEDVVFDCVCWESEEPDEEFHNLYEDEGSSGDRGRVAEI